MNLYQSLLNILIEQLTLLIMKVCLFLYDSYGLLIQSYSPITPYLLQFKKKNVNAIKESLTLKALFNRLLFTNGRIASEPTQVI